MSAPSRRDRLAAMKSAITTTAALNQQDADAEHRMIASHTGTRIRRGVVATKDGHFVTDTRDIKPSHHLLVSEDEESSSSDGDDDDGNNGDENKKNDQKNDSKNIIDNKGKLSRADSDDEDEDNDDDDDVDDIVTKKTTSKNNNIKPLFSPEMLQALCNTQLDKAQGSGTKRQKLNNGGGDASVDGLSAIVRTHEKNVNKTRYNSIDDGDFGDNNNSDDDGYLDDDTLVQLGSDSARNNNNSIGFTSNIVNHSAAAEISTQVQIKGAKNINKIPTALKDGVQFHGVNAANDAMAAKLAKTYKDELSSTKKVIQQRFQQGRQWNNDGNNQQQQKKE